MPFDMRSFPPSSLPPEPASRLQVLQDLLNGVPLFDSEGRYIGMSAPMITRAQFMKLADVPKLTDAV